MLVLASGSPRRARLLEQMGLSFEVRAVDLDEAPLAGEPPAAYVVRLARAKAEAAAGPAARSRPEHPLTLGADTAVVLDGRILGKPGDADEAVAMLLSLSDKTHQVMTGVAVHGPAGTRSRCVVTEVRFRAIEPWEAQAYQRTGEGADKAGAYGIQGIGGIFAASIRGSYSAVVGLPVAETEQLLRESGLDTWHERTHG